MGPVQEWRLCIKCLGPAIVHVGVCMYVCVRVMPGHRRLTYEAIDPSCAWVPFPRLTIPLPHTLPLSFLTRAGLALELPFKALMAITCFWHGTPSLSLATGV